MVNLLNFFWKLTKLIKMTNLIKMTIFLKIKTFLKMAKLLKLANLWITGKFWILTIHFLDAGALHSFPHFHFLSTNPNQFQFCSRTESSLQSSLPAQTHLAGLARCPKFRKAQVPYRQLESQQFVRLNKLSGFQTKIGRQFGNARTVPSEDTGTWARRENRLECLPEVRQSRCRCWKCRHKAFKRLKI